MTTPPISHAANLTPKAGIPFSDTIKAEDAKKKYNPDRYKQELDLLAKGNPAITSEDENKNERIVWVFSGRASVFGSDDGIQAKREKENDLKGVFVDTTDDIERLLLGIDVSNKRGKINVFYNGTPVENRDFKIFLKLCDNAETLAEFKEKLPDTIKSYYLETLQSSEKFKDLSDIEKNEANALAETQGRTLYDTAKSYYENKENFPDDNKLWEKILKFKEASPRIIIDGEGIKNSIDQVKGFNKYLENNPQIQSVDCVSSAFHLPRLARSITRYIEDKVNPTNISKIQHFQFHGIDLACERPGTKDFDLACEVDAIRNYIDNKSIAPYVSNKISLSTNPEEYRKICNAPQLSMQMNP